MIGPSTLTSNSSDCAEKLSRNRETGYIESDRSRGVFQQDIYRCAVDSLISESNWREFDCSSFLRTDFLVNLKRSEFRVKFSMDFLVNLKEVGEIFNGFPSEFERSEFGRF